MESAIEWSARKNAWLRANRGVSFEAVETIISAGGILDDYEHPNQIGYPGQRILVVMIADYACLVPYVKNEDGGVFLKTIIPSRKANRFYNGGDRDER